MLNPMFRRLKKEARRIAKNLPLPDFYLDFTDEIEVSCNFFKTDPLVGRLRAYVVDASENDYGHGIDHCEKVAVDAGALAYIEGLSVGLEGNVLADLIRLAQFAGLLHDIRRKNKDHASKGAVFAKKVLRDYPLSGRDSDSICTAIYNHEAFGGYTRCLTRTDRIVSGCLYDSDKFRWGPDNFTSTVWGMVEGLGPSFETFLAHYPAGMEHIERIGSTFRTATGRAYGPQFIDMGLFIGRELLAYIKREIMPEGSLPPGR
ncbi:MAG: hypothetical protein GXP53_06035 [Deltaproteobacteria bacterium]|nr:hypothetical protein [Deltaproteobacteria bacterium]